MKEKEVLKREEKRELLKILDNQEVIEKRASLSWDGKNLLLRLPKEIADYLGINKKNRSTKKIKFIIEEKNKEVRKTFDIVEVKEDGRKNK